MCETHDNKEIFTSSDKGGEFSLKLPHDFKSFNSFLDGDILDSKILSIGSTGNSCEFGIKYQSKNGVDRIVILNFDECGMWFK